MIKNHFPWNQQRTLDQQALSQIPLRASLPIASIEMPRPSPLREQPQGLLLELRDNLFLVRDEASGQFLSAFEGNPGVSLLIKTEDVNNFKREGPQEKKFGESMVRFLPIGFPEQEISFFLDLDPGQAIELYRTFPKTYTLQLDFHALFTPLRKIGKGATSVVYQVRRKIDGATLAVKAFNKSKYLTLDEGKGQQAFLHEFKTLSQCNHEGICRFEGTYQTDNTIYLVQEYLEKSLTGLVMRQEELPRKQVLSLMEDLLRAVCYLHSRGIFHRDIKLENIMLRRAGGALRPVLIDLGMSHDSNNQHYIFEKCGTPGFIAPEVYSLGAKDPKGDVFSLGVILHILLFKTPVFAGNCKEEVMANNRAGKMSLDDRLEQEQFHVKDLLLKMLDLDTSSRLSAFEALQHPSFGSKNPVSPSTIPPEDLFYQENSNFQLVQE